MLAKYDQAHHPLFIPTLVADLLTTFYIDHRRELELALFILESRIGITRGRRQTDAWDWDYELYRETTKHCNAVNTGLVYLERRLCFVESLSNFVLDSLSYCEEEGIYESNSTTNLIRVSKQLRETALNAKRFAGSQLHQTLCLQKRSQALTTVVRPTVLSRLHLQN